MAPKKKKHATKMTTDELARRVFPKPVVEELQRIAHENDEHVTEKEQVKRPSKEG